MSSHKKPKTLMIPEDVEQAIKIHLARTKSKHSARTFSDAVTQGLRLFLSHHGTSVPKILAQLAAN